MEAQPLIVPNVTTPMGVRDVMVLPSMANVVRGVDAHDGTGIWQVPAGNPGHRKQENRYVGDQSVLGLPFDRRDRCGTGNVFTRSAG